MNIQIINKIQDMLSFCGSSPDTIRNIEIETLNDNPDYVVLLNHIYELEKIVFDKISDSELNEGSENQSQLDFQYLQEGKSVTLEDGRTIFKFEGQLYVAFSDKPTAEGCRKCVFGKPGDARCTKKQKFFGMCMDKNWQVIHLYK